MGRIHVITQKHENSISDVLFQSIGEGAIVIDDRGNVARVNKVALEILGFTAQDLLGKWYPETLVAENEDGSVISNIERPIMEAFLSGKPVRKRVFYHKKDGGRVALAVTVSPIMEDDVPIGAIEIFRDITNELQLEHAKDEFISIASHQLRTPATVVKQYLGMIMDGYITEEEQISHMLQLAYNHNEQQLQIIDDLLNIAQAEAKTVTINRTETDLIQLLDNIIETQKGKYAKRKIDLSLETDQKKIVCHVDKLHMQMVFENLLHNANKYSPPDTAVVIRVNPSESHVTVDIHDQGVGIHDYDIPKLFKKFSRASNVDSSASGTGLGLYWAKKLVELHNGEITVASELGRGSVFSVKIPKQVAA